MNERILIIEDDPAILKVLQRGLAYEGYTVDVSTDGGRNWSRSRVVDATAATSHVDDLTPIVAAYDGRVYVSYLQRDETTPATAATARFYLVTSHDRGRTFGTAAPLGPTSTLAYAANLGGNGVIKIVTLSNEYVMAASVQLPAALAPLRQLGAFGAERGVRPMTGIDPGVVVVHVEDPGLHIAEQ